MTQFRVLGGQFYPMKDENIPLVADLPLGFYRMGADPSGFYYEKIAPFSLPSRLYGKTTQYAERILKAAQERPLTTGVLLCGEKGSGKTLLAKKLAIDSLQIGWPIISVETPFNGSHFVEAIQMIGKPVVLFFDEFDKVYKGEKDNNTDAEEAKENAQSSLLGLLDGLSSTKSLVILTANNIFRVSEFMINRPGRIFYNIKYSGLDQDFIEEYCGVNLVNKDHTDGIVEVSHLFKCFTFDHLQSMVEEMNRSQEDAKSVVQILNAKPFEIDESTEYTCQLFKDDEELQLDRPIIYHDILSQHSISVSYMTESDEAEEVEEEDEDGNVFFKLAVKAGKSKLATPKGNPKSVHFFLKNLTNVNKKGQITFESKGYKAIFTKVVSKYLASAYSY